MNFTSIGPSTKDGHDQSPESGVQGSVLATFYPTGFGDPAVPWRSHGVWVISSRPHVATEPWNHCFYREIIPIHGRKVQVGKLS